MKQKLSILLCLVLCAGSGHGLRLPHDVDTEYGREFSFGSKAAAGAETEPVYPSLDDDENEISRVEFEPELGTSYAVALAPVAAAAGPAPGPVAAAAAGSGSMKWWLPPLTMPSFPLFPNPGMPLPGMPFKPIGWDAPAPPGQAQPTPPAAAGTNDKDPNTNQVIN